MALESMETIIGRTMPIELLHGLEAVGEENEKRWAQEGFEKRRLEARREHLMAIRDRVIACGVPTAPETLNAKLRMVPNGFDHLVDLVNGKSIYIYGCSGSGKTYTAVAILKAAFIERYIQVSDRFLFVHAWDLKDKTKDEIEDYKRVAYLVIDNVGGTTNNGKAAEVVEKLIMARHEAGKKTILTSSHDPNATTSSDVASRISDERKWKIVNYGGMDLRQMPSIPQADEVGIYF